MIDIAPARWSHTTDPRVFTVHASDRAVVVILDACGDWGAGDEAAKWTRAQLETRWERVCPSEVSELSADISEAVVAIPEKFRDPDEWGFSFSVAAAIVNGDSIAAAALGAYGILIVKRNHVEPIFDPNTLVRQFAGDARLTPEEKAPLMQKYWHVCAGPYASLQGPPIMCVFGPHKCEPGKKIVVSYHGLHDHLLNRVPGVWQHHSARELQQVGNACDAGCYPVFVVSPDSAP